MKVFDNTVPGILLEHPDHLRAGGQDLIFAPSLKNRPDCVVGNRLMHVSHIRFEDCEGGQKLYGAKPLVEANEALVRVQIADVGLDSFRFVNDTKLATVVTTGLVRESHGYDLHAMIVLQPGGKVSFCREEHSMPDAKLEQLMKERGRSFTGLVYTRYLYTYDGQDISMQKMIVRILRNGREL
jgi:hypothetical protein